MKTKKYNELNWIAENKIDYKGYTIEIFYDEVAENPRNFDNLCRIVTFHKRYDFGNDLNLNHDDFDSWNEIFRYLLKKEKAIIVEDLWLYDHSGLWLKIGNFYNEPLPQGHAEFDTMKVGYAFVNKDDIKRFYGVKKVTKKIIKKAHKQLKKEIELYSYYVGGMVYGYTITDKYNNTIDSCGGYYGPIEESGLLENAIETIENYIKSNKKEVKINNKETLINLLNNCYSFFDEYSNENINDPTIYKDCLTRKEAIKKAINLIINLKEV